MYMLHVRILSERIAALCYERTDLQRQLFEFRNARHTQRHVEWEERLRAIEMERRELIAEQKRLLLEERRKSEARSTT